MSKHTPGPWFNGQDGFNLGSGVVYARHSNGNPKDVATIRGWGGEQQANSRLISAAPDLLEALESLFQDYKELADSGDAGFWKLENTDCGKRAIKAIAKAKGE